MPARTEQAAGDAIQGIGASPGQVTALARVVDGPDAFGAQPDLLDEGTAADWLPGIRDEHEGDDAGWMARWLDRQTWDRRVTPNVIKRTGERPARRGGRRFR